MEIKHFFIFHVCIEHVKAINNTKSYIYIVFTAKTELTKYSFTQKWFCSQNKSECIHSFEGRYIIWLADQKTKTSNEVIIQDSPYKHIKETQFCQVLESLGNIRISCCKFFFEGEISKENFPNTSKFFIKYQIISNSFLSPLMFSVWISLTCSNKQHDTLSGSWQKKTLSGLLFSKVPLLNEFYLHRLLFGLDFSNSSEKYSRP